MYTVLIAAMIFISAALAGFFAPPLPKEDQTSLPQAQYTCCDNNDCSPKTDKGFSYEGDWYDLLKTDIYMNYGSTMDITVEHMDPTNKQDSEGNRVFINKTERNSSEVYPECISALRGERNTGYDRLYGQPDDRNQGENNVGKGCYAIPNEFLIYVCRKDSTTDCFASKQSGELRAGELKFDVYVNRRKYQQLGSVMPDVIKNCYKPPPIETTPQKIVFRLSPGGQQNLQLRTFHFTQEQGPTNWLTPYCKPAIYLYPERKTEVNVSVFPQGKMLLTIPPYPKTGWDVVAEPNGNIYHQNTQFDYLYYEAAIPDQLLQRPKEGFIIKYDERALFLTDLVTKLGLSEKETKQFVEYWVPILPQSPYYFIGVVPQDTLQEISPVLVSPQPKHLIRITLYFQALEKSERVKPPLILPVHRDGFTVVEWGGIFKRDKDHPFSCFM